MSVQLRRQKLSKELFNTTSDRNWAADGGCTRRACQCLFCVHSLPARWQMDMTKGRKTEDNVAPLETDVVAAVDPRDGACASIWYHVAETNDGAILFVFGDEAAVTAQQKQEEEQVPPAEEHAPTEEEVPQPVQRPKASYEAARAEQVAESAPGTSCREG